MPKYIYFYLAPGPGNYRLPSEFGYYVSRNAFKDVKNNLT